MYVLCRWYHGLRQLCHYNNLHKDSSLSLLEIVLVVNCFYCFFFFQVCFLPGTLALGATKGVTKEKAMKDNLITFEDLENLKLAEDLAKTCF